MAPILLKINVVECNSIVTVQSDGDMIVRDVCQRISERVPSANQGQSSDYGLFKSDKDSITGCWLNEERTLEYYNLKSGDILQYKSKLRLLRMKTLDDSIKTLKIDESQTVTEVVKAVCVKIGLSNPEEFSFTMDENSPEQMLRAKKLDALKKKRQICNKLNWLKTEESLCEQGIVETAVLTLRKKFFFSDQNVHCNDPVQLNLLYVQLRDAVISGTLPCTCDESVHLAALQCQILYGNRSEDRHKPGFLELHAFLPNQYTRPKGVEKSIFDAHQKLFNLREINAKLKYVQFCQSLSTYGVTFFLVKEMAQHQKKLVSSLLGVTRESIIKVDSHTKAILKTWPLTTVRRWGSSPNTFTLDFGDHSESAFSVQTSDGEAISSLIAGYVDIITQRIPTSRDEDIRADQRAGCPTEHSITMEDNSLLCSTTNPDVDQPLKARYLCDNCSLEDETPELPMRGYLQDSDFMRREFKSRPVHPPAVPKTSPIYEKPATLNFINQEENEIVTQLTWQEKEFPPAHKTETSDYMTLTRRQDDTGGIYQSLIHRELSSPPVTVCGKAESSAQTVENHYQPLDLTRMNMSHDSSVYQTIPFCKD